jgi:hypothetical protein
MISNVGHKYRYDRTASCSSGMWSSTNDIFTCKQPVAPAEAAYVIECLEVQDSCFLILDREVSHPELFGASSDISQEFTMWTRTISTELV